MREDPDRTQRWKVAMVLVRKWVEVDDHLVEADKEPPVVVVPTMMVRMIVRDANGEDIEVCHEIPVRYFGIEPSPGGDHANAVALFDLYMRVHAEMHAILESYQFRTHSLDMSSRDYFAKTGASLTMVDNYNVLMQGSVSK